MKKITFFLSALLISAMSFAQTTETITVDLTAGTHDGSQITWTEVNGNITIAQLKGTSTTAVNKSYIAAPRLYKGHILSFTCNENYTITAVNITYTGKYLGSNIQVGTTIVENVVQNNATLFTTNLATTTKGGTHVITTTNTAGEGVILLQNALASDEDYQQLRPTSIAITYIKAATTEPTITCGDVYFKSSDAKSKELEVIGENLTEAIVATLKTGTDFAVEGTLTATGGTLTISVIATETGEYSDVLVLTSGETVKEVNLSATVVKFDGDGTKENPYSVADVIALGNPGVEAWVEGYIIGSINNNEIEETPSNASNIALADAADDKENYLPVQLPDGEARTALNVVENPNNIGAKVAVYGKLEAYFSMPGVKSTSDYEFKTTTAIDNISIESNITKFFENGQLIILKDGVRYNAQGQMLK